MAELYEERSKGTLFWNAFNSLEEILYKYDPITGRYLYETDETKVRECLEEFSEIITSILTGGGSVTEAIQTDRPVEKAGKKMSGKNRETLKGIYESLGAFLREFDDPEPEETGDPEDTKKADKEEKQVTKQEVEGIVEKAVEAALAKATNTAAKTPEEEETAEDETKKKETVTEAKKKGGGCVTKSDELTPEGITAMVEAAITKALEPQHESVTVEQVQEMITAAVAKAVDPVLQSRGLPTNLGGGVEKAAGEQHYLHGIL